MSMARSAMGEGSNTFLEADSATARLYDEARQVIPAGTSRIHYFFQPYPIYASSGKGCYLTDREGVQRLDFLNNMTSLIHGHANPAIKEAIIQQLDRGTAFSEPTEEEVGLAELLCHRVDTLDKIRFANSGTEAVMMAIKLARAYTGRSCIAKFEGFYHGYYDYVQVSFNSSPANWGPEDEPASTSSSGGLSDPVLGQVLALPYNNPAAIEALLAKHGNGIATLITDPLSNRAGFPPPAPGFMQFLREITKKYGIVLIFDEVISFRVAYGGAQGKYGGNPDLTTFGKIMGGGLPVGAVGGNGEIMSLLDASAGSPRVISGGTFSGNPLTMVAGLAAMEQMTPNAYAHLDRIGARLRDESNGLLRRMGEKAQFTGDGSLFRIMMTDEPIQDYRSSIRNAAPGARFAQLHLNLLDEGIVVGKEGLACLSTPMSDPEVDSFLGSLERAVTKLQRED
jgi:glutamate-1-semialdehyde 2,1-aminomutase